MTAPGKIESWFRPARRFTFIVGAPRCGTTSLARYLRDHPDVCFSSTKEPHYFSRYDLRGLGDDELRALIAGDYLDRYFSQCGSDGRMLVEGSTTYLYAAEQMEPILRLWPQARFIIALRDPMQMIPSLHQRLFFQGDESVRNFDRAWRLRTRRALGKSVPPSCVDARWLQYEEAARLGKHAERFLSVVGAERCLFVLFDDLEADPVREYRRMLDFIGLADDGRSDFGNVRPGRGARIGWLQRLIKRPPVITRAALGGRAFREHLKPVGKPAKQRGPIAVALKKLRKKILVWNREPVRPLKVSPAVREEIRSSLRDDVERLSRLLGRDLSHWLSTKPKGGSG